jgi:hypothetical protein
MISLDDYVIDVLMRDLVGHDRRVVSFLVYLWFAGEQRKGNVIEASYRTHCREHRSIQKLGAGCRLLARSKENC